MQQRALPSISVWLRPVATFNGPITPRVHAAIGAILSLSVACFVPIDGAI